MAATVYSISWSWWEESFLPALDAAREEGGLEPLEPFVPGPVLDPAKHILTGRRFLLFGPKEHKLMNLAPLLLAGVRDAALDHVDFGSALHELAEALLATTDFGAAGLALTNALEADAHLPDWLTTGRGPGVLSPTRGAELIHLLAPCTEGAALMGQSTSQRTLEQLLALLQRSDATCWIARREPFSTT